MPQWEECSSLNGLKTRQICAPMSVERIQGLSFSLNLEKCGWKQTWKPYFSTCLVALLLLHLLLSFSTLQPRHINVSSLINDPPRFLAKTSNGFLSVKALSRSERHPDNAAELPAQGCQCVKSPSECDAQSNKLLHMLRRIIGSYGRRG